MHQNREELIELTPLISQLFEALGLVVNMKKLILVPGQSIEFLGFLVNSSTMYLILPAQKRQKIQQDAHKLLKQETVSVRKLARSLGKVSAAARAVWQVGACHTALAAAVIPESQTQPDLIQKFNVQVHLTKKAREELTWWTSLGNTVIESPLCPRTPHLTIESDASNIGWGACQGDLATGGVWSKEEATHHINYLELIAAFLAV